MASVIRDPGGKRVQWSVPGGDRRTLRLGNVSVRQAEAVRVRVEQVLASKSTGVLDAEAERWLQGLDDAMHEKLSRLGLVPPRASAKPTLKGLLDAFFATLAVKPGTRLVYEQARRSLEDHFGSSVALESITALAAAKWQQTLRDEGLSPATVSKRIKTARMIWKKGVRWKLASENVFSDLRAGVQSNKARMFFITRADAQRVLESCPDAEWRLLFALSRFGGLRCPSEHLELRWSDVLWDKERIVVRSCKTEGYEGGEQRVLPMFPELKVALRDAFEQAPEGAEFVISRYRNRACNLRTQLLRIVDRAGVRRWPKTFQNLRSSRQSELAEEYPISTVCAWLGNSVAVAQRHYLQPLDHHFARATGAVASPTLAGSAVGGNGAASAVSGNVGQRGGDGANVAA